MSFIRESYAAYKKVQEAEDHEISMARGELEAIADKATQLASMLQGKSDEGNPLEAWVQSKITKAKDYIDSVSDYMMYNPDINESKLIENDLIGTLNDTQLANIKKTWANKTIKDVTPGIKAMLAKMDMPTKVAVKSAGINVLSDIVFKEEVELELEESTFEKIFQMQQDGKSLDDIAKELKLKPELVKKVLGESKTILEGLSDAQIAQLKKEYEPLKGKTITGAKAKQLMNILDKFKDDDLIKLSTQNIPFISSGSKSKLAVRNMKFKVTNVTVPGLKGMAEESDKKLPKDLEDLDKKSKEIEKKFRDSLKVPTKNEEVEESFKDNIIKKLVKPIKDYNKKKEEPKKEDVKESKASDDAKKQGLEYYGFGRYGKNSIVTHKSTNGNLQSLPKNQQTKVDNKETQSKKPAEAKDLIKTIKDLNIDDLRVDDDKKFIHIVKEFDPTIDSIKDAKAEYMDIVKTLNKKGINYKPKASQDIENDKDQEYMQINFSVKKEEVKEPTGNLKDACWTGYVAVGTKMKNGKRVPNCVPKSEAYKGAKAIVENAFKKLKEKK